MSVLSHEQGAGSVVADALAAAGGAVDLESVTRPLLAALQELTGLSSTYLTRIDWSREVQTIRFSVNSGGMEIGEGLEVAWTDTLCRRALESGQVCTDDVPAVWGDSQAARDLGIQTYVSAPLTLDDGEIWGTLCGASPDRVEAGARTADLMRVFSTIIADTVRRERARQVSEERAAEVEARLRSRARFLAMAEHQLKNPLAVIAGWASVLQADRLDPEASRHAVDVIANSADRLGREIEELLREATSQVVASELNSEHLELGPFLEELGTALLGISSAHPLEVVVPDGLHVAADPRALQIAIEHLVENAVKYSPSGGRITLHAATHGDGRVRLGVRDRGIGLPEGVDVFEPFVRGDHPEITGTGLGLHIVRSMVQAMDGEVVAVRSDPGTEFRIDLPASSEG